MATFHPEIRTKNEFNKVYIRICHRSKTDYIPTTMILHKSGIKKGKIADHVILANCALLIKKYVEKLNNVNVGMWTVTELKKYLISEHEGISFTGFAEKYIGTMYNENRNKPALNYKSAVNSLKKFMNKENIFFHQITSLILREWIKSMSNTARAKQMYPVIIGKLFEEGCMTYNDYDRNIMRITNQPFKTVKIPSANVPQKRSVEPDVIRKIVDTQPVSMSEKLAHDAVYIILMLAGINTTDLYHMEKSCYSDGKLKYNRRKTMKERSDMAYFEIRVPNGLFPLFEKYSGENGLFNFRERYSDADNFLRAVNNGLKSLCRRACVQVITSYCLRHTWATVAQNRCGASTETVAFCLNHVSANKVTEGYIRKDFSPVDRMNEMVTDAIFGKT